MDLLISTPHTLLYSSVSGGRYDDRGVIGPSGLPRPDSICERNTLRLPMNFKSYFIKVVPIPQIIYLQIIKKLPSFIEIPAPGKIFPGCGNINSRIPGSSNFNYLT